MEEEKRRKRKRKHKMETHHPEIQSVAMPPPAQPTEVKDQPLEEGKKKSISGMLMRRKWVFISVGVGSVMLMLFYYYMKPSKAKKADKEKTSGRKVTWADEHGEPLETSEPVMDAEGKQRVEANDRKKLAQTIETLVSEHDALMAKHAELGREMHQNRRTMETVFGSEKAAADSALSDFEVEQSLETAFLMKTDLDRRKDGIRKLDQELRLAQADTQEQALRAREAASQAMEEYRARYGTAYIPASMQRGAATEN